MKRWITLTILTVAALLPLLLLQQFIVAKAASPSLHYVAADGDCGGAMPCYADVQTAVNAAAPHDEIRIAGGVYTGTSVITATVFNNRTIAMTQTVFISQSVHLDGGYSINDWANSDPIAQPTIMDGEREHRVFTIIGSGQVTITGVSVTNGNVQSSGNPSGYGKDGGGFYIEAGDGLDLSFTLRDSVIYSNTTVSRGGGLFSKFSHITLTGNRFMNNAVEEGGGGVCLSHSSFTVNGNKIISNTSAYEGGGIMLDSGLITPYVNQIFDNDITGNETDGIGGGLIFYTTQPVQLYDNIIEYNHSERGGGISLLSGQIITISRNIIRHNRAVGDGLFSGKGGGIMASNAGPVMLDNNVIADNQADNGGGGLYIYGNDVHMRHNTLARNQHNGIEITGDTVHNVDCILHPGLCSYLTMSNTVMISHAVGISLTGGGIVVTADGILWHNTPITTAVYTTNTNSNMLTFSNIHWGDPLFAADGYHLTDGSAAIDVGVETAVFHDIDGQLRPQAIAPDLGADEFMHVYKIYLPALSN